MRSLHELFRIGMGPSSSHTMAPRRAAQLFRERTPEAVRYQVTLYGSLAATGRGHLTHAALREALAPHPVEILEQPAQELPDHPNGMDFVAFAADGRPQQIWRVCSIGGGALRSAGETAETPAVYSRTTMAQLLDWCAASGKPLWQYVEECEGADIWAYLADVWQTMQRALQRGLEAEGVLPGGLHLQRKARSVYKKVQQLAAPQQRTGLVTAYALAVSEENANGGIIATAPTCGACGVLPAVLAYLQQRFENSQTSILRALATAGLIGNLVKCNASISGAEVGCQGEIGTACAMAAGAAAYLLGATPYQIEYAAEMGLEHHLGLTCDPVAGLVQIPCIERNAMAATRALDCAEYALFSDGRHVISFDQVVLTMEHTGHDLPSLYRETAAGGLASVYRAQPEK